jgi:tetratricopeptide (TPR) repeat protein
MDMKVIRIQERLQALGGIKAIVSFDYGPEYPITISNPFSEAEEQSLEWYFEGYLEFPFLNQIKAQSAVASIAKYGETLFSQVFKDLEAYTAYKEALKSGWHSLQFEIVGSPSFQTLHWETLKDPKLPQPFTLQASMVRKSWNTQVMQAKVPTSPTINVLLITARPFGKRDVGHRTISRPLVEGLRRANLRVRIDILRPGTYKALENHLREVTNQHGVGYYHIVHFDVHGSVLTYEQVQRVEEEQQQRANRYQYTTTPYGHSAIAPYQGHIAFLFLQRETDDSADPIQAETIANLLQSHQIPIAILNACQSGKETGDRESSLGNFLAQAGIQFVLAMGYSVTVSAAELMMRTFYNRLFAQDDLPTAIRNARQELFNSKGRRAYYNKTIDLEDWILPIVYQNQLPHLSLREFALDEESAYYQRNAERYPAPKTSYGFVGRDLDILQIEQRLLTHRNMLLIQGMGGAGKTTLLQYLGYWWQTTGLVDQVFYFGYDERAWTRQQIMVVIAQKLLPSPLQYAQFQSLPTLDAQQAMLRGMLRSTRHLLILDNLESITGASLAIQHTLSQEEQTTLHHLLIDLSDGQTLILLGSRSSEIWLAPGVFDEHIYELNGLDAEAASQLTDLILKHHKKEEYLPDRDLQHVVKLLDGFPLALEVVLANLAQQTPKEILTALEVGDVALDPGEGEAKTESIVRCIDYSHSNLSPDAQQLLACLAPFTSVIWQDMLKDYTDILKQQPTLKDLPFEHWPEVIQQATNWGLLHPDAQVPQFLRMQPILPYFLRARLATPEHQTTRTAIETAFREYYTSLSGSLLGLLLSKDPDERQLGQVLTHLEYDNLVTGLKLAVAEHVSIHNLYRALTSYLDMMQDQQRGLELGQFVLSHVEAYPQEILQGPLGSELARIFGDTASHQLKLKHYSEAKMLYQKTLKLITELKQIGEQEQGTLQARTYYALGVVAQEQRQWEQAEQYYQKALWISIEFNDRYTQANTYHNLGSITQEQQKWDKAEQYYQQALQISIESKDRYSQADTYHNLGIIAQKQQQWEQAEQYYQQSLQISIEFQDWYSQAGTYYNLGSIAQKQQQWEQAEQYYQQALQISIESKDRHSQARTYHNLGSIAQEQQQWEQAEQYYRQALQISIEFNDRYAQASTYHNLGIIAQKQQQWEQAEQYYRQALQISIEFQDRYSQAGTYYNLGSIAQEQQQWEQAEQYYQQALQISIESKDRYSQADTYYNLGKVAREQQQWEQAEQYYRQALQIYTDYKDPYSQAGTYHQLGSVAQERRQWTQARDYFLQALEIFVTHKDASHRTGIVLHSLARLWQVDNDASLPTLITSELGISEAETEELLRKLLEE